MRIAVLLAMVGCGEAPSETCSTIAASPRALIGGSQEAPELGLDALGAIGKLTAAEDPSSLVCTGTLVARNLVLTAAHCTLFPVVFADAAENLRPVVAVHRHASLDLALLRLEPSCSGGEVLPLAPSLTGEPSRAVLAGYGVDEHGRTGSLRFVEEEIDRVSAEHLVVDGRGRTGACTGDSGGPLLIRGDAGGALVLGVLSFGDESCLGLDYYVRVDLAKSWIADLIERGDKFDR